MKIHRSTSASIRSADKMVSKQELLHDTLSHIGDVNKGLIWMAWILLQKGRRHDHTKIDYIDDFWKYFHRAQQLGDWGYGWYEEYHLKERHHLQDSPPADVDLFDVLEKISDSVMAGMARKGEYKEESLPPGLLERAYYNTVKKLLKQVEVVD